MDLNDEIEVGTKKTKQEHEQHLAQCIPTDLLVAEHESLKDDDPILEMLLNEEDF